MARTLSSRGDDLTNKELLQELVFVLFDQLDIEDDPSDDTDELWGQLEEGVIALAENHETAAVAISALTHDLIQLTLDNNSLVRELTKAAIILEGLAHPPHHEDIIEHAMGVLRREGQASIDMVSNGDEGVDLTVNLTFDEELLREGLRVAIHEYNNSIAEGLLTGKLKTP